MAYVDVLAAHLGPSNNHTDPRSHPHQAATHPLKANEEPNPQKCPGQLTLGGHTGRGISLR